MIYEEFDVQLTLAKPCPDSHNQAANLSFVSSPDPAWYAAYTVPRHEKTVAEQLGLRQIETYVPLGIFARRWAGRRAFVSLPLFPGYVFVHIPLNERIRVLEHPSVLRLVTSGGKPTPLPDEEIERLRAALLSRKAEPFPFLSPGKRIRIKLGPLCGLEGAIVRRKGSLRFVVAIDFIQRSIAFELDASDLALVN